LGQLNREGLIQCIIEDLLTCVVNKINDQYVSFSVNRVFTTKKVPKQMIIKKEINTEAAMTLRRLIHSINVPLRCVGSGLLKLVSVEMSGSLSNEVGILVAAFAFNLFLIELTN
jgi:hypothetical protein